MLKRIIAVLFAITVLAAAMAFPVIAQDKMDKKEDHKSKMGMMGKMDHKKPMKKMAMHSKMRRSHRKMMKSHIKSKMHMKGKMDHDMDKMHEKDKMDDKMHHKKM